MGIFKRLFKREKKQAEMDLKSSDVLDKSSVNYDNMIGLSSVNEQLAFIKENCDLIVENKRQIKEAKSEYQAVTSYLTDIQRIDLVPKLEKGSIEDVCRNIINLNKERQKFQEKNLKITQQQYHLFEQFEIQIPKDLPSIKEAEEYQKLIQSDMKQLEKEKKVLTEQQKECISKQSYLRGIALATCLIVIILNIGFALLWYLRSINLQIPFLFTILMGMASVLYIFIEERKNQQGMKILGAKLNRQIILMNRVKIKSVNNLNYLDYTYNRYGISSYQELKDLWVDYVKVKDAEERYQDNTKLLDYYQKTLIRELKQFGIADAEIWIYQTKAIVDEKEMVEVRHRLNVRRQKIRGQIESTLKQNEECEKSINSVIRMFPDIEIEAGKLLKRYGIEIA